MSEIFYSTQDRILQLEEVVRTLGRLIDFYKCHPKFQDLIPECENAKIKAEALIRNGFTQSELSSLGRLVTDHWQVPSQVTTPDYMDSPWYLELRLHLDPALAALSKLTFMGELL